MKQVTKNRGTSINKNKSKKRTALKPKTTKKAVRIGTSKLEEDFARDFLDKLGVKYIYQFEAKDIGRFYDFAVLLNDEMTTGSILLIEIDGGYYHSDPRVVEESKMNPMQKHNKRVDKHKDDWALMHGIPLMRIWEKDIRENPKMVMEELKKRLYIQDKKVTITEKKNKRHINKIK
jgi:very-short-patch-repair endonuclease